MQPASESAEHPRRPALQLQPFRALRYDTSRLDDLGAVTSPPYDVLDDDTIDELLALHPHNVVLLILPPRQRGPGSSYAAVGRLLAHWRSTGVLRTDPVSGLYVYEYTTGGTVVRGLVGCVSLHTPVERVVLPHEDVLPGPVHDRLRLMLAARANLEPILLVYDGGGAASAVVEDLSSNPALAQATAPDGSRHQIWQITDSATLAVIAADLAPRQALIADGHHRYATYRRLQTRLRGSASAAAAQVGLAMLVDQVRHPLRVGAVHRSLAGVTLAGVHAAAGLATSASPDKAAALVEQSRPGGASFVITDGRDWLTGRVEAPMGTRGIGRPAEEIAFLHERLLPAWGVVESQVGYHHDVPAALRAAQAVSGVAVLTRAPTAAEVMAAAREGQRMPRKSTSFGPKPRMGLVCRLLDPG